MYFKRPSFKRGGSTGIGQLAPRVKAQSGFMGMNFGVGQGDNIGYQKYLETMRANKANNESSGIASMILGPRYTDPNFVSPFLKEDSPFFSNKTGFEFMNLGTGNNESRTFMTNTGPKIIENIEDIKITADADELPQMAKGPPGGGETSLGSGEAFSAVRNNNGNGNGNGNADIDKILTGELSMKDSIEGEVDILKELLKNTGMSKGEKALLLAKAVGTPGSLKDKLDVGANEALKYKKEERKQDKAIILTAYKNYKAKDLAGDKMNREETLVKNLVNRQLKDPKNTKSKSQLELEAWKSLAPGAKDKDVNKEFALLKLADRGFQVQIQDAQSDIKNYSSKNTPAAKLKVAEAQRILDLAAQYAAAAGLEIPVYAEGGRVERAVGSPMMGETVTETVVEKTPNATMEATEVVAADNIEPMAPVTKMDFADLRNRLPQEITDDIVQLLANSEEALQAFAYIKTQEDINAFNVKYGVNLILPAETV
jgi:hypothetical protein